MGLTAAQINILIKARDEASRALSKIGNVATGMGKAIKAASRVGALALVALGAAALKFGTDFQKAEFIIRRGTGATGDALEKLKGDFTATFRGVPESMAVVAQATADLNTRLGLTGPPLQKMTRLFLDLARVADVDVAAAVAAGTRAFGDWSIATDKQAAALDHAWRVAQQTGIGVDSLLQKVVQFGAPLRQFGFDFENATVLMGKWEKEGVNAEAILGALKIGVAGFARENVDAVQGLKDFIAKLTELGPGAEATGLAIKLFGSRAGPDMAAAVTEGRFALDDLLKTIRASDETIAAAAEETLTWIDKLRILRNDILVRIEPALTAMVDKLTELADSLGESGFAGGLERAARAVRDFAPVFEQLSDDFIRFGTWVINNRTALVTAIAAIGIAFAIFFPTGALLIGLNLIIIAFGILRTDVEKLGTTAVKVRIWLLEFALSVAEGLQDAQNLLSFGIIPLLEKIGGQAMFATRLVNTAKSAIADAEATLLSLQNEAAVNNFGDLIAAQAHGAEKKMRDLRAAMIDVFRTMDALAAQQAAFQVALSEEPGLTGRDLLRNVDADITRALAAANPAIKEAAAALGDTAAGAIAKALTARERWEKAGRELADALASGLRGGTVTMTEAVGSMLAFMDALPAKFSDIAATVGNVIGAFANAQDAAQELFDTVAERGSVTFQDLANAARLGAFDMARDFADAMAGRSSDIGAAIFQHAQEEAAEAAQEAADEFVDAFASAGSQIRSMFEGIAGTISGLVSAPSVESAAEGAELARLRLLALLQEQEVLKEQAQALLVIRNLEAQIAELRRIESIEVSRMTAEIEAQQVVIAGIEAQMEVVRAVAEFQLDQLDQRIDVARANLEATKSAAREAIAEIDASLRITRQETRALIQAAESEARAAASAAQSIIGDLERELQRLEADIAAAVPEDGARSIRDIMADIDRAGVIRRPALLRELELAKQANLERQEQIGAEIEAQRDAIAEAEAVAAIQIAAAEKQLATAERSAERHKEMWDTMVAEAQAQVDDLRAEQELLRANLDVVLDMLEKQKEFAEADLETLQQNLDAYTASIDAQVESIKELITLVEEHESVAAKNLRALRDQIAELELSAEIRRLERDMVAAQVLASNELLKTDAEVLEAIGDQTAAYSQLASALDILRDNTLDMYDAAVLAQLGFTDLATIIFAIVAGLQPLPEGGVTLPEFHAGGIVPGPVGAPRLIRAHGGEGVLTAEDLRALIAALGGGGAGGIGGRPVIVNVYPREISIHGDVRESLADLGAAWATPAVEAVGR